MNEYDKPKRRRLKNLRLDRVDLVTAGANPGAFVTLFKAEDMLVAKKIVSRDGKFCVQSEDGSRDFGCYASREAAENRLRQIHGFSKSDLMEEDQMADAETVEAPEAPAKEVAMSEQTPVETVAKTDFVALQKQLADEAEARNLSVEKAAALEERIAKMEREQKQADFVAKAKDLSNLGTPAELGGMLLEASEGMSEAAYQLLDRTLKAVNAQIEKGALFAQMGRQDGEALDVVDRITEMAKAKVAAGEAKTLQIAKLMVITEHPELSSEYTSARSAL
jgi:hypothetical protein